MKGADFIALSERRANALNARAANYSDEDFAKYMAQLTPKKDDE